MSTNSNLTLKFQNVRLVSDLEKELLEIDHLQVNLSKNLGIIGHSGSGKSSLVSTILFYPILKKNKLLHGKITLSGEELNQKNRYFFQAVFQDPISYFNPHWSLLQCLKEPLILTNKWDNESIEFKIFPLLSSFQIQENLLNQKIIRFSGGELQRIAFLRAILCEPKVIILDEAITGLDPIILTEVLFFMNQISKEFGIQFILISHNLDAIVKITELIIVLDQGRLITTIKNSDLFESNNPIIRNLTDSWNLKTI